MRKINRTTALVAVVLSLLMAQARSADAPQRAVSGIVPALHPLVPPLTDSATKLPYDASASRRYQEQYADALNARGVRYLRLDCVSSADGTDYSAQWSALPEGRAMRLGPRSQAACHPGHVAVFKVLAPPAYHGRGATVVAYVAYGTAWSVVRNQTANFLYGLRRLER
ncbi:hypothetical protein [Burkholderia cenocepacia]|uniref:hypothetical protein n=1 Tax=Burkholderia cenocepacia TaxID=95486 RepID=UPI00076DA658|nr:hypothetical protein [Burkholderia cenocepacia]KWU19134.1 hypothetical protein AS149_12870 [Burkholderia cenocepacia]